MKVVKFLREDVLIPFYDVTQCASQTRLEGRRRQKASGPDLAELSTPFVTNFVSRLNSCSASLYDVSSRARRMWPEVICFTLPDMTLAGRSCFCKIVSIWRPVYDVLRKASQRQRI